MENISAQPEDSIESPFKKYVNFLIRKNLYIIISTTLTVFFFVLSFLAVNSVFNKFSFLIENNKYISKNYTQMEENMKMLSIELDSINSGNISRLLADSLKRLNDSLSKYTFQIVELKKVLNNTDLTVNEANQRVNYLETTLNDTLRTLRYERNLNLYLGQQINLLKYKNDSLFLSNHFLNQRHNYYQQFIDSLKLTNN